MDDANRHRIRLVTLLGEVEGGYSTRDSARTASFALLSPSSPQRISSLCSPTRGARREIRQGDPLYNAPAPGYVKVRPSSGCSTST